VIWGVGVGGGGGLEDDLGGGAGRGWCDLGGDFAFWGLMLRLYCHVFSVGM
jgi:hypothetical protein